MTGSSDNTVAVIGLGKLGMVLAAAIGSRGKPVKGFDTNPERGELLIHGDLADAEIALERGLADALQSARGNITIASSVAEAVEGADITFIVVPTPSRANGSFSADAAMSALREIGVAIRNGQPRKRPPLIVLVSTVSPGTTQNDLLPALQEAAGGKPGEAFCYCYAPALVALGTVLDGFMSPDFAFVGETDPEGGQRLSAFMGDLLAADTPIHRMSAESVEIAKVALNNFLTLKISFSNLIGQLCHASPGAEVTDVLGAIGADTRVGRRFLNAGMGYGGPCLPRDTQALAHALTAVNLDPSLPQAAAGINVQQNEWLARLLGPVVGKNVCVYGLSYREGSNISIASASIALANKLDEDGAIVIGIDPLIDVMDVQALNAGIHTTADLQSVANGSDFLVLTVPVPIDELEQALSANQNLRVLDVLSAVPSHVERVVRFGSGG